MPFLVGDDDIAAAEAALGGEFPAAYRRRMSHENGGSVPVEADEFELFKILDRSDLKRMARTSASDIVRENVAARAWVGFPDDAIAMGSNRAGDLLVMFRRDGRLGPALHAWDHETGSTVEMASDFSELFGT